MRGRYLVQNRLLYTALSGVDALLKLTAAGPRVTDVRSSSRRVLLALGGHLGDVVIASGLIPRIRGAWPDAEIGVLLGSWAGPVLAGHADVRWVHHFDHWKLNRSARAASSRARGHVETRRKALREIRRVGYDTAIDCYPYFPNSIPLLHQAGIPVRVGYSSGGFAPLLTHALEWQDDARHMGEHHRDLLELVGIASRDVQSNRYSMAPWPPPPQKLVTEVSGGPYSVVHMGSGLALKEWPRERWKELATKLRAGGRTLVFTGSGALQEQAARLLTTEVPGCHNFCNRLDWKEFVATLADAEVVVTVDSVAGHLAAAVGTPVVVLMTGMNRIEQWRPLGERVVTVTNVVPCAPCFRSQGCAGMECVREITVDQVLEAMATQRRSPASAVARDEIASGS